MSNYEIRTVSIALPMLIKDVEAMQFGLIHTGFKIHPNIGGKLNLHYDNKWVGIFNPYPKNVEYNNRCAEQEGKPKKGSIDLNNRYSYLENKIKQAYAIGAVTKQANRMWWKAEIQKSQNHFLGVLMNEDIYIKLTHQKKLAKINVKVTENGITQIEMKDVSGLPSSAIEKLLENMIKALGGEMLPKTLKSKSDDKSSTSISKFPSSLNQEIPNTLIKLPVIERLPWDVLPKGEWNLEQILKHFKNLIHDNNWREKEFDKTRIEKICKHLKPSILYIGREQFEGYVVFCFDWTKKVVLECPIYGNAIYVINGDWQKIAKLSKWEARYKHSNQVTVINHTDTWLERLNTNLRNPF